MGGIKSVDDLIKYSESLIKKTGSISSSYVAVGLPEEKTSEKIYKNGINVVKIGAVHEFGADINHPGGTPYLVQPDGSVRFVKKDTGAITGKTKAHKIKIPRRSFLKDAFESNSKEINDFIKSEYKKVIDGKIDEKKALGRIGMKAENISKGAFRSDGYGKWERIKTETKRRKGSSKPLFDTGTLRNSITSVVRKK